MLLLEPYHVTDVEARARRRLRHIQYYPILLFVIDLNPSTEPGLQRCWPEAPAKFRVVGVGDLLSSR